MLQQLETIVGSLAAQLAEQIAENSLVFRRLEESADNRDRIASRISILSGEREVMIGRRAAGNIHADDGVTLGLVMADIEGLRPILQDAVARVDTINAEYEVGAAMAARMRREIDQAEAAILRQALICHADDVGAKLMKTLVQIDEVGRQAALTDAPAWRLPRELYQVLRGLAARQGIL